MRDMIIRGNHITGRARKREGEMSYPIGISFQVLHANYANIVIEDNVIDVPTSTDSVTIPKEAGSLSMRFYPLARWEADNTSRNVVYRNNRDPNGRLLAPSLVDWYYKNPRSTASRRWTEGRVSAGSAPAPRIPRTVVGGSSRGDWDEPALRP